MKLLSWAYCLISVKSHVEWYIFILISGDWVHACVWELWAMQKYDWVIFTHIFRFVKGGYPIV